MIFCVVCGTLPVCFYTTGLLVLVLPEELCTRLGGFLKMPLSCVLVQVSFILEFPTLQKVISEYQKCYKFYSLVALTFKSREVRKSVFLYWDNGFNKVSL